MKYKFMLLAKKLSKKSNHRQHKIGGVLVKKHKLISLGFNKTKTHTKSNHPFKSIHCELDVILSCENRGDLIGSTLYLYREHKNGTPAIAKPCTWCMCLIQEAGIKKIIYSTSTGPEELYV